MGLSPTLLAAGAAHVTVVVTGGARREWREVREVQEARETEEAEELRGAPEAQGAVTGTGGAPDRGSAVPRGAASGDAPGVRGPAGR
ncbi:hypothetical protein ACH4PU_27465 [Streptomyces sp. NPDC021100]|uniref:hypothetical protein n=1 Tax=Streptomyces sp. NPDC021100 TaxID=3365114 RepID=UPI0037B4DC62